MDSFWIIVLLAFFTQISAEESGPDKCQVANNSTLDECLERFARKWDDLRRQKPQLESVAFPILAVTVEEFRSLCSRIEEAKDGCGRAIETCDSHEIARFIQQNFIHGCSEKQSLFYGQSECLLSTINGQQQCLKLLKRTDDGQNVCAQAGQFFKCIHQHVYKSCQAKGLAALVHTIDRFGCDIRNLDARVELQKDEAANCSPEEKQEVTACFQPLLRMWSDIRDNDTSFLETAFPVFKFRREDLVKMCDIVRVIRGRCFAPMQRCPGHPLPEFVNAVLGAACGTQQANFLLSYECVQAAIAENDQCRPYTVGAWQPGHLKEICGRMPQYYKCLEKPLTAKCFHDGVGILAQSIRQYGCELITESSATADTLVENTTVSIPATAPATVGAAPPAGSVLDILDFGVAPPSGAPQPPAPSVVHNNFLQANNIQPFLLESNINPFPAIPTPGTPSLLVAAPAETIFNAGPLPNPPAASIQPAPPASALTEPGFFSLLNSPPSSSNFVQPSAWPVPAGFPLLETFPIGPPSPAPAPLSLATVSFPKSNLDSSPGPSTVAGAVAPASSTVDASIANEATAAQAATAATSGATVFPPGSTVSTPILSSVTTATTAGSTVAASPSSSTVTAHSSTYTAILNAESSSSTTAKTTSATAQLRGTVVPIPMQPQLFQSCNIEKRNQLRECLNPLYRRWVDIHGRMITENRGMNLTFPIYHYAKNEVVELCDQYASAFLRCSYSLFSECLNDGVVYLANAIFGYICSPQNVADFSRHFDCISNSVRQRDQCLQGVQGRLLSITLDSSSRCVGAKEFYQCNRLHVEQSCTSEAGKVLAETVKQYGCELAQ